MVWGNTSPVAILDANNYQAGQGWHLHIVGLLENTTWD